MPKNILKNIQPVGKKNSTTKSPPEDRDFSSARVKYSCKKTILKIFNPREKSNKKSPPEDRDVSSARVKAK